MIADQLDESQDSLILEGFDISELNEDTINRFRNRLSALKPNHPWILIDLKTFLIKLGAYAKDRKTGKEGITAAGLLMFGEESSITDEFPDYFLDYREKYSDEVRWDYRVISSDGTWSGNLFDFYYKIINKITDNLNVPFRLLNGIRQEDTRVHKAVREAVANALIHADYRLPRGIVIERGKTYFKFSNPGTLRITLEEALRGGISDPRNKNIFKMFNLLGIGERAGSGLENIQLTWKEQEWTAPDLEETYGPDRVTLTLRTVSILPKESIEFMKLVLKEEYKQLSKDEVMALVTAHQEGYVTNFRLQQLLDTHALESNKILSSLVEKEYLVTDGIGRGTKYYLTSIFENSQNNACKDDDTNNLNMELINSNVFDGLSNDEIKIVQYIIENGSITNKICREQLGFKKHRSTDLFNRLIEKEKIKKQGRGNQTNYVILE